MKKLILSFFILLIFSQLAFSQNEVFAKYYKAEYGRRLFRKPMFISYDELILYKAGTFKYNSGSMCLSFHEEGKWQLNGDTIYLSYLKDSVNLPYSENRNEKFLLRENKLFSIDDNNQVGKFPYLYLVQPKKQIKNKS